MGTALIIVVILTLMVLAFAKDSAILHMVCIPAWFIGGYVLYNQTYANNTYIPTAVMLLSFAMVIVHIAVLITRYLGKRIEPPTYDEEKTALRDRLFKQFSKPKRHDW